jgi:hypothetical protein
MQPPPCTLNQKKALHETGMRDCLVAAAARMVHVLQGCMKLVVFEWLPMFSKYSRCFEVNIVREFI